MKKHPLYGGRLSSVLEGCKVSVASKSINTQGPSFSVTGQISDELFVILTLGYRTNIRWVICHFDIGLQWAGRLDHQMTDSDLTVTMFLSLHQIHRCTMFIFKSYKLSLRSANRHIFILPETECKRCASVTLQRSSWFLIGSGSLGGSGVDLIQLSAEITLCSSCWYRL